MKAMILAAGLGERMRPLTETRAKPALPLLNRPIIHHALVYLKSQGVTEAVINLYHQADSIRGLVGDGRQLGVRIHYSSEPVILGTAGGLKKAEGFFQGSGTFILINSDFVSDISLTLHLERHRAARALATLILTPPRPGTDYGAVVVGTDDRVVSIAGRPAEATPEPGARSYTFTGIHLLEPEFLHSIPPQSRVEINRDVYPPLIAAGRPVRGSVHEGFWRELGTPRLYLEGSLRLLKEQNDPQLASFRAADGVYLDRAEVAESAVLEAPVLLGKGSTVGDRTSLLGVVAGRQARIGADCSLRSCILWDGARVGRGATLTDCIVASGAFVPSGARLSSKILLRVEGYHGPKDGLERAGSCWMTGF